jgi:hypothetical protein
LGVDAQQTTTRAGRGHRVSHRNNEFDSAEPADEARRRRLTALLGPRAGPADGDAPASSPQRAAPVSTRLEQVCALAGVVVGMDGAGVTVMSSLDAGLAGYRDQLAATGTVSRRLEDLQLTTGEGPCLDAYRDGVPVLIPDLAGEPGRWLGFGPEAISAGAAAVFSLPLQVGAIRLGTLDLHRRRAGPLSRDQLADALTIGSLATEALLELAEERTVANPEDDGREHPRGPEPSLGWLPGVHTDVHVASGMVSAQIGTDVRSALLLIRAHSFAHGDPIHHVAQCVIDRHLTFPPPGP